MSQTVRDMDGSIHEFPDDATPDEINSSFAQIDKERKINSIKDATGISPGFRENFIGGMLHGAQSILQGLPNVSSMTPASFKGAMISQPNERPIDKFDAYKFMGTEDKPINSMAGLEQTAGELFAPSKPIGKVVKTAYPALKEMVTKYSAKNIAKEVLDAETAMKQKYSGLYQNLENKAAARNIDLSHIDTNNISDKLTDIPSIQNLINEKNIINAQKAISDLAYMERSLGKRQIAGTLDSEGRDKLKEATKAKNYIQENMFKDNSGQLHQDLLDEHRAIQEGYAKDVIPYTKNAAIQSFKKNDMSAEELLNKISKGKFRARKGMEHPNIGKREIAKDLFKGLGYTSLGGMGFESGRYLINKLLGNK